MSITIIDLPAAAYPDLERASRSPRSSPASPTLKREDFSFRSGIGKLISAPGARRLTSRCTGGLWWRPRPPTRTSPWLINVDVPEAALAVYSDAAIRKALATVTFRPAPIQEQLGLLPFKVGELAGFRVVKALAPGCVIMTEGPSDEIDQAAFHRSFRSGSGAPEHPDDRAKFARDMLIVGAVA